MCAVGEGGTYRESLKRRGEGVMESRGGWSLRRGLGGGEMEMEFLRNITHLDGERGGVRGYGEGWEGG